MQKENQLLKSCDKNNLSSPSVSVGDLPHPVLLLNKGKRPCFMWKAEDPGQQPAGMTPNLMGFTLIELLVVVLIIGILAAVAVPQYQKAVEKSKSAQALVMLKNVYQAAKAYELANGSWPTSWDVLAVEIPWTGHTAAMSPAYWKTLSNEDWSLMLSHSDNLPGLWLIRNSGKYAYAGFVIFNNYPYSGGVPSSQIVCVEGSSGGGGFFVQDFAQSQGDYCQKIMKGTQLPSGSANRYYTL